MTGATTFVTIPLLGRSCPSGAASAKTRVERQERLVRQPLAILKEKVRTRIDSHQFVSYPQVLTPPSARAAITEAMKK